VIATSSLAVIADEEPIVPIPQPPDADPLKLALGERLFADPRLSHDRMRACLTCHDTRTNGATANPHDLAADGSPLPLNTGTIFNASLSFRLNWEGTFRSLEEHVEASLTNPKIMATSTDEVLSRLKGDPDIVRAFQSAYRGGPDRTSLLDAIAIYERSLVTPGSRFDRWLEGDPQAISADELNGYHLFKSLGCVSCHQGMNIGGNLYQRHGIFRPLASPEPEILRVPSLRNVATTPPYFHDGSAPTLDVAVRQMGTAQLNRALTDQQVKDIVVFLGTLTGNYRGAPLRAVVP
jgi:cytochrome c peroxidase